MANQYLDIIKEASRNSGVPENIIAAVMSQESGGNTNAVSKAGARGLMQLMPGTAKDLGVTDPHDPVQNIHAGAKYLAQMFKQTGNWEDALKAYNWGIGNLKKFGADAAPAETRAYAPSVLAKAGLVEGLAEAKGGSRPAWGIDNTAGLDPAYKDAMVAREEQNTWMLPEEKQMLTSLGIFSDGAVA